MKRNWILLLALGALLPGLLLAQDKPKKSKQKVVIIRKSVDEDGNKVVEKIVREGDGGETMEWRDENGNVVIHQGKGDVDIDIDIELEESLEGLEDELRQIDVGLDEMEDGMKHFRIAIEPDGEVIEWRGDGDIPKELMERLEKKGLHFLSLEGDNFTFGPPPNKALLGVQVGQEIEVVHENGEAETVEVPEGEGAAVLSVFEGSAAEAAGIRKGDVITAVDGAPIQDYKGLVDALSDKSPGDVVVVALQRDGQPLTVEARLQGSETAPSAYEFRFDDEEGNVFFFDKDGAPDGRRHSKVIVIQGDDDDEEAMPFVPEEGRPALELEAFEAFPNPADNQLTVRFTRLPAPVTIRLLDAAGQQVYKEYIKDFNGAYDQRIGLEGVPKGLLLLTVEQEGRVFTEKVMATGR